MNRWIFILAVSVGLLGLFHRVYERHWNPKIRITFLNVGQGDSILIQLPKGKTLLVDAGGGLGFQDLGEREALPELASRSILALDYALLTHPDWDHGAGFRTLFAELPVREFWVHADQIYQKQSTGLMRELLSLARQQRTTIRRFSNPTHFSIEGVDFSLVPVRTADQKTNNQSLVLRLCTQGCCALFLGDLEKEGEQAFFKEHREPADLVKVAHHGSKTSSTLFGVRTAASVAAVISVGLENNYGHPANSTLMNWRRAGTEIFRTDYHGGVEFTMEQGKMDCRSTLGACGRFTCHSATPN